MVSSDTTYNHKQRMPRFSIKEPEPAGCPGGCGHIGYVLPVPVPRIQVSHKNQLRLYLNTISCIMSTWIYYISRICFPIFAPGKIFFYFFQKFFKFLPLTVSLFHRSAFYRGWSSVLWQLKNIHHHEYGFWWVAPWLQSATRPDWIAHSAARQRGRGGRRRRWWEVCVNFFWYF